MAFSLLPADELLVLEEQLAPGGLKQYTMLGVSAGAQLLPQVGCNRTQLGEQRELGLGRLFCRSGFSMVETGNFMAQGKQFGCVAKFM